MEEEPETMTQDEKRRTLELAAHLSARASDPRFGRTGKRQAQADADMLMRAADRLRQCVLESSQGPDAIDAQKWQELLRVLENPPVVPGWLREAVLRTEKTSPD
jgi:hypothetical protein